MLGERVRRLDDPSGRRGCAAVGLAVVVVERWIFLFTTKRPRMYIYVPRLMCSSTNVARTSFIIASVKNVPCATSTVAAVVLRTFSSVQDVQPQFQHLHIKIRPPARPPIFLGGVTVLENEVDPKNVRLTTQSEPKILMEVMPAAWVVSLLVLTYVVFAGCLYLIVRYVNGCSEKFRGLIMCLVVLVVWVCAVNTALFLSSCVLGMVSWLAEIVSYVARRSCVAVRTKIASCFCWYALYRRPRCMCTNDASNTPSRRG